MVFSDKDKTVDNQNGLANGFKEITKSPFIWLEHVTSVDLSNRNISTIEDNVIFPQNLVELNLSHNKLTTMPTVVLNHEKLKMLDLSYNELEYFDETPNFCHSIEILNLSHNHLLGPPYWVWSESPAKLANLDLSFNIKLTDAFRIYNLYFEELLSYKSSLVSLKINNCSIQKHWKLLCTFFKLKVLELGSELLTRVSVNNVTDLPCEGLENCCDIQSLNLSNTNLYNVKHNIDLFRCLVEINLSHNYINGLPEEFCNLINLETCILSSNSILYLPDDIGKLKKLVKLSVDNNELCMLPDGIIELKNLEYLDVYNNCLYEIPEVWKQVAEIDCSQNYFDEPQNSEYVEKKEKLRSAKLGRIDFRKIEVERPDSEHSVDTSLCSITSVSSNPEIQKYDPPSSPEDWDSDKYWVPGFSGPTTHVPQSPWVDFVKRKMSEGNFCPMDAHSVSIAEKVKYEKLWNNKIVYESDGQFDDFSDDNS